MATPFSELINNLWEIGFPTLLTFIFFLAVVFGLLRRSDLFEDQTVDATVSVVVAFMITGGMIQFLGGPSGFSWFFALLSIAVVVLLGFVLILGMLGVDVTEVMNENEGRRRNVAILAGLILILILLYILEAAGVNVSGMLTSQLATGALMTIAMLGFIYVMARQG